MAKAVVLGARDGDVICEHCVVADTAPRRIRGLLGRKHLDPGEGLLLRPAPSIHTFFMRFAIDAVFLDSDLVVLKVARDLRPWRMAGCRKAKAVLELPAGETVRRPIDPGDRLEVLGVPA
jgi:uncharacterized membrane protein (UPF0127 family)